MRTIGSILIALGLLLFAVVGYENNPRYQRPLIYSPRVMLNALWHQYKNQYIDANGRTIDPQRGGITTSEGQSYTLLRAAWQGDQDTFDNVWKWTQNNLQRPDHLFAWLYGKKADGSYGVLADQGGNNTATDADTDIAVALIFAYDRWREPAYLDAARQTVQSIWAQDVVQVKGDPVIASNNLERNSPDKILVNPSYFAPYAYRMFAQVDPAHDWKGVIDSSYRLIRQSASAKLGSPSTASLPPDWILLDRRTGDLEPATTNLTTGFGYEAARLPWRLALDWSWYRDPRDAESLKMFGFLADRWQKDGALFASYAHDGTVTGQYEAPVMYGGSLGYFLVADPDAARQIYERKLVILYDSADLSWRTPLSYYDTNWAWFGLALYHGALMNLSPFGGNVSNEAHFSASS